MAERESHTGDTDYTLGDRRIKYALLFWLAFCLLAVLARGIRWDETHEWAQIMAGDVIYPEAHPHNRYVWGVFSIQHYVSWLLYEIVPTLSFVSYFRNVLYLFITIAPLFLLTSYLARSITWGAAAVILALQGLITPFETTYPLSVWPHSFSNGPIGSGWGLLAVYGLATKQWKTGLFFLTTMPVIHLGQFPPVFVAGVTCLLWHWIWGDRDGVKKAWLPGTIGLLVCFGVLVAQRALHVPAPTDGPYFSDADAMEIWRNYKEVWYHTSIREGLNAFLLSHVGLVLAMAITGLAAWNIARRESINNVYTWLFAFCFATASAVWIAMAVHNVMGPEVPYLFIAWIPYRLANMAPFVLLACVVASLKDVDPDRSETSTVALIALAGLVFMVLTPTLSQVWSDSFYTRYLADGLWLMLTLAAFVSVRLATKVDIALSLQAGLAFFALLAIAWLAIHHQFAAACLIVGAVSGTVYSFLRSKSLESIGVRHILQGGCTLGIALILLQQYQYRDDPPRKGFDAKLVQSDFDRDVAAYLDKAGDGDAMLVANNYDAFLQARTGHPVMAHWQTGSMAIYTWQFAPSIQKILREVYGISYGESLDGGVPHQPQVVHDTWTRRSAAEWKSLGDEYDFNYVIAPVGMELDLPPVLQGAGQTLYAIEP